MGSSRAGVKLQRFWTHSYLNIVGRVRLRDDGCLAEDDIPAEETPLALRQDSENQDNTIYRNIIH